MVLTALILLSVLALVFAIPLNFVLMLAAGNLGYSQYGFWDLLPAALALKFTFGSLNNLSNKP